MEGSEPCKCLFVYVGDTDRKVMCVFILGALGPERSTHPGRCNPVFRKMAA